MIKSKIVLFDLDGTLADVTHRRHHVTGDSKEWDLFHQACVDDIPMPGVCDLLGLLANTYEIWIVSGRDDSVADQTYLWLHRYGIHYDRILMRKKGDYTEDQLLKQHWLDTEIPKERVAMVFDDRARVVAMWRANGLPTFQVAEGNF